jgi:hypothetical protein
MTEGQADSLKCQEHADVFYTDGLIPCRFYSQSVDKYFEKGVPLCLQEIIWLNCPGNGMLVIGCCDITVQALILPFLSIIGPVIRWPWSFTPCTF